MKIKSNNERNEERVYTWRDFPKPPRKAFFAIDGGKTFEGYSVGRSWNGFACPLFEKSVAQSVIDECARQEDLAYFNHEKDAFVFQFKELIGSSEEANEFTGTTIIYNGQPVKVYDIGSDGWVWDEIEPIE